MKLKTTSFQIDEEDNISLHSILTLIKYKRISPYGENNIVFYNTKTKSYNFYKNYPTRCTCKTCKTLDQSIILIY